VDDLLLEGMIVSDITAFPDLGGSPWSEAITVN